VTKPKSTKGSTESAKRSTRAVSSATPSTRSAVTSKPRAHAGKLKLTKVSITIPQQAADAARERAGSRGLSAYIADAVEQQLRRDALVDWIEDIERLHGSLPDDELSRAREILLGEAE
jgi:hypothetical protein